MMEKMMLPSLSTGDIDIDRAFRIALGDITGNILQFKDGLLEEEKKVIIAGMDYNTPWTRDAAINTWNGCGLLYPNISKNTMLSVLKKDDNDRVIIGGQYWDAVIWVTGAWSYYLYTGDQEFLKLALDAAKNSLEFFEATEFNQELNLFRGAACYGDGVGAYPERYTKTNGHSTITHWVEVNRDKISKIGFGLPIYALSTNCLYYNAYSILNLMIDELDQKSVVNWKEKAEKLKEAINQKFWSEEKGRYIYIIDEHGNCDFQEGIGLSFALLFGIADNEKKNKIFENTYVTSYGIPCLWPVFKRYKEMGNNIFGVHNGSVWPHIQGFWSESAIKSGKKELFLHELKSLAQNVCRDKHFAEYYSPYTGEIDNGYQEGWYMYPVYKIHDWEPASRQTWSATSFLRMILFGILGMEFTSDGIIFNPYIPWNMDEVVMKNIAYREMIINIEIKGKGSNINKFFINGQLYSENKLSAEMSGEKNIKIIVD